MKLVLLTALGIGGSTVVGAVISFREAGFPQNERRDLSFAAGIMLAAAIRTDSPGL